MMFCADTLAIPEQFNNSYEYGVRIGAAQMDPLITMANMAAVTRHIGLTATVSTIYPPYIVARQLATLDSISGGRVGWNVVTSHDRSEEHTSDLQSLMPNSYAVFFLNKKK